MAGPPPGFERVMARVHIEGLRPGEWGDLEAGDKLDSLVEGGLLQRTGYHGEAPPADLRPRGCCT